MKTKQFLSQLIGNDYELNYLAFNENNEEFINLISTFKSKIAICVSSSFFNENINLLTHIKKMNYIESIISLPYNKESDNLIVILLNPNKKSDEFILIDESNGFIHENVDDNENIRNEILNALNDFENTDNAVLLNVNTLISGKSDDSKIFKKEEKDEYADFLALKEDSDKKDSKKRRILSSKISDDILSLKKESSSSDSKKKVISNDIAEDILDLKEEKSIRQKIRKSNVFSIKKLPVTDFTTNYINEMMYDKKRQNIENILYKNNKRLIDEDVEFKRLGEIADLRNIEEKNYKNSILIATCKDCSSKLVYYNNDVSQFNDEIYVEIDNICKEVSKEYLYEYLNSSNGMDELLYFSKGFNYIRADNIKSVKVPIPPLHIQKEIVDASRESREFFKTVNLLQKQFNENILDYKHVLDSIRELKGSIEIDSVTGEVITLSRSWRHAYQGLIWPLAISYLSATKGGFESVEKKDNYLVLFEFIAAFNCIILLSGLPEDVYRKNFYKIWDSKRGLNEYKSMTFANWVYVSKNLAKVYRTNNFTSKLDENLFNKISSDKILDILEKAKDLRNDEAHGSHTTAHEAKEVINELDLYLEDIFDILEIYSNYKFIYVTGDFKSSRQAYNHRVILLNGPCAQPIYDNINFDTVLYSNCLYLYNPKNNNKLLIRENLMKFQSIDDEKKRWGLFLYNSCDKGEFNAFYKCFQSKEEDIKMRISSFKHNILYNNLD